MPQAIRFLETFLVNNHQVFEWGSGASIAWYDRISKQIGLLDFGNVEYRYVPLDSNGQRACFDSVSAIDSFDDDYFDVIAVDGRERIACVLRGRSKLKPAGVLILDDSHRITYRPAFDTLSGWHLHNMTGGSCRLPSLSSLSRPFETMRS